MAGGILQAIGWAFLPLLIWPLVHLVFGKTEFVKSASEALITLIDSLTFRLGEIAKWLLPLLVLSVAASVFALSIFGITTTKWLESAKYFQALIIMLGAAATLLAGQHVRVDIFFSRMSETGKARVDLIGFFLLLLPACILLTWNAQSFVGFAWAIREGSSEADGIRGVYILKTLIPIFAVTMLTQGLAIATRAAMALNGQSRPPRPEGVPALLPNDAGQHIMSGAEILAALMFLSVCGALMSGYNVAFTLAGTSLLFAGIGVLTGTFDPVYLLSMPGRIYPLITREILIAVPLFVFMGVMLEKSRIAEDLLENMGTLFGPMRGGLGISVIFVGALLAASTGIVGATVVTMGLLSLPTMLNRGYAPSLASASIAASGTLGQIIPPSIVLVILADQISNAFQEAQRSYDLDTDKIVSVGDLFAGALLPGFILVTAYALYIFAVAVLKPADAPAQDWPEGADAKALLWRSFISMLPPIFLIIAVLGSILSGYATPTRGAALGALGAILLACYKTEAKTSFGRLSRKAAYLSAAGLLGLVALDLTGVDLRISQTDWSGIEKLSITLAAILAVIGGLGALLATFRLGRIGALGEVSRSTLHITAMVFVILIGATIFSLVFRGFGGDEMVARMLEHAPGGPTGAFILVMVMMFILGFFLDFIEITFVVVPLVAPPLLATGMDPVWLGIVMALNLQTSFLTPPFGFALFYLRGVAPPEVTTTALYKGVLPFIAIQIAIIGLVIAFPGLATAIPESLQN